MKLSFTREGKAGLPPGEVFYTGEAQGHTVQIKFHQIRQERMVEFNTLEELVSDEEFANCRNWINVLGIHDEQQISKLGEQFAIHRMYLEDIANIHQRPKAELTDNFLFCSLKHLYYSHEKKKIMPRHLSFIIRGNTLISLTDGHEDIFLPIYDRLLHDTSRIRQKGHDFLLYSLLDLVVDDYIVAIDHLSDQIDELEKAVERNTSKEQITRIHRLNKSLSKLLKFALPVKAVLGNLRRNPSALFGPELSIYLNDLEDHLQRVIDECRYFQERVNYCENLYFSILNLRTNDVMKYLAAISTIFLPLSFVAGVYGMNFSNMPELHYQWGYPSVLMGMLTLAFGIIIILKRKKWL